KILKTLDKKKIKMKTIKYKSISWISNDGNEDKKDKVKQIRKAYQDNWKNLTEELFTRSLSGHVADMQDMYPVIKTVVELVLEFSERFTQAKQTKTMIDFSDLEHYSLRILTD